MLPLQGVLKDDVIASPKGVAILLLGVAAKRPQSPLCGSIATTNEGPERVALPVLGWRLLTCTPGTST